MKTEEQLVLTAVWRNGGFSASYDSFVGKQTVVFRINICGKNPPLRQAANRSQTVSLKPGYFSFSYLITVCGLA